MYKGFIYEWTNRSTGQKYIGSHIGHEDDRYLGSGVEFLKDLKLFGTLNYDRKILEYVEDESLVSGAEEKWLQAVDAKNNSVYLNKSNHACGSRVIKKESGIRPMCSTCNVNPRAIAYHRNEKVYYRSDCPECTRKKKKIKKTVVSRWKSAGYKKKTACDKCSFRARFLSQLLVFHIDGNLNNPDMRNLRTICLNCAEVAKKTDVTWRRGDLEPDL